MKDLALFLIKSIVDSPDAVTVNEVQEGNFTRISFSVASEDAGKVIGKKGKIIKSLRNVIRILALKEGKKFSLELNEA
ncbi:KH domain-containing protein [Candidatus Microgenomates bacterium]|nr:KH domain-containing protein [Candidatus Microgenomates bacterium]